jgi:prepilin peptidase CpaA
MHIVAGVLEWSVLKMWPGPGHPTAPLQWLAVIGASLIAAITDLRSGRIPNWLTGSVFLAGMIWAWSSSGMSGLGDGFSGALVLAVPYIVLFLMAGGGAADAKLMGAVGAWLGLSNGCAVLLAVCVSGALLGIGYAVIKKQTRGVFCNIVLIWVALTLLITGKRRWNEARNLFPESRSMLCMPYGVAIFMGVCIAAIGLHARKLGV